MNKQKKLTILAIVFALSVAPLLLPNTAHACSCVADTSQEEDFDNAEAVFVGRVLSIEEHRGFAQQLLRTLPFIERRPSYRTITFHVTERWKGIDANLVGVATGFGGGDCGYYFAEGETYLVYANDGDFYGEELATGICSRTEVLRHAEEDISALGLGDLTFTDAETVYNPIDGPWWNEIQNEIADFFIWPITRTVLIAPWYTALGIIALYLTLPIVLLYWLIRRSRK